ncbi:MAG: DNA polymerase III subunit gamma/tau, partial [Lachnospiraceae bacterium]
YLGEMLTYDHVLEVLGAVDTDVFSRLLREILAKDVKNVLGIIEELVMQGRELSQLSMDFTWYLRNLLLVKSSDNMEDVLDVSTENLKQLTEEAQLIEYDALLRYIRVFSELSNQLKYATQKRVLLEVTLIKLCKPAMETNTDSLLERIRAIEMEVEKGTVIQQTPQKVVYVNGDAPKKEAPPKLDRALKDEVSLVVKEFRTIANETSGMLRTYLKKAKLSVGNQDQLLIVLPDELSANAVDTETHKEEIEHLIEQKIGKTMDIEIRQVEEGRRFEDSFVDIEQVVHMDITIED